MAVNYSSLMKITSSINKLLLVTAGPKYEGLATFDHGLRNFINPLFDFTAFGKLLSQAVGLNTLLCAKDNLGLYYFLFHPNKEREVIAIIGPYRIKGEKYVENIPKWINKRMLEAYYNRVYCVTDEQLFYKWIHNCCDLCCLEEPYIIVVKREFPLFEMPLGSPDVEQIQIFKESQLQEHKNILSKLLAAVSKGDTARVLLLKQQLCHISSVKENDRSLKEWKRGLNTLNNLLRYTAVYSNVNLTMMERIYHSYEKQIDSIQNIEMCDCIEEQMLLWYCDCMGRYVQYDYSPLVQQTVDYINEHLTETLTLRILAAHFSVNPSYLSDLFRRETDLTLTSFITMQRVYQAEQLLALSDRTIAQIAEQVGILDVNYFTHLFKRIKGIPPGQYRKETKKAKSNSAAAKKKEQKPNGK